MTFFLRLSKNDERFPIHTMWRSAELEHCAPWSLAELFETFTTAGIRRCVFPIRRLSVRQVVNIIRGARAGAESGGGQPDFLFEDPA